MRSDRGVGAKAEEKLLEEQQVGASSEKESRPDGADASTMEVCVTFRAHVCQHFITLKTIL